MNTEILCLIDRSGSMSSMINESVAGYNNFIDSQRKLEGSARVTLAIFDDRFEYVLKAEPLSTTKDITKAQVEPRGLTALKDSLGKLIVTESQRISTEEWADKVIVVVLTDGGDNSSKEYDQVSIKALVQSYTTRGWEFIFLGANINAYSQGSALGITKNIQYAATGEGMTKAYDQMNRTVANSRQS
jgi:hypothetical protein